MIKLPTFWYILLFPSTLKTSFKIYKKKDIENFINAYKKNKNKYTIYWIWINISWVFFLFFKNKDNVPSKYTDSVSYLNLLKNIYLNSIL